MDRKEEAQAAVWEAHPRRVRWYQKMPIRQPSELSDPGLLLVKFSFKRNKTTKNGALRSSCLEADSGIGGTAPLFPDLPEGAA